MTPQAVDHSHAQRFQRRHRVALCGATTICQGDAESTKGGFPWEKFHRVREPGVIFQGIKTQPTQIFGTKKQANKNYIKKSLRICDFDIC